MFGDLAEDWRIVSKCKLRKQDIRVRTEFVWLKIMSNIGLCRTLQ
jgi:hypothetical protein